MDRDKLILGLYLASIIIGAGILALPLKAAKIGLIPMVLLITLFGAYFYEAYKRIIEAALGVKHVGLATYDEILSRSGMHRFGRLSLEYGMIVYIIPADVVYTLFSATRYVKLAEIARDSKGFLWAFVISAIVGVVLALVLMKHEIVAKFFALLAGRSISILIIYALGLEGTVGIVVGSILFMLTMFLGEYYPEYFTGSGLEVDEYASGGIHPRHYVAALYTVFKVIFVLAIAIFSLIVVAYYHALPKDVVRSSKSLSLILSGVGVTAFAFVGTGVYNIVAYDRIRRGEKRKGILFLGAMIPAFLYLVFTTFIVLSVDSSLLLEADKSMEPSLLALARKLESLGISISTGLLIGLAGIFTLLAVSMSYLGFTDTLGGRMEKYLGGYDRSRALASVIATLIAIAIAVLSPDLTATSVLDVAGSSGGMLFLLFLPFLLLKGRKDRILALIALALIPLSNLPAMISGSMIQAITAAVSSVIALILGALTFYEVRKSERA